MDKSYFYDFIPVQFEVPHDQREQILTEFPPPPLPDSEEYIDIQNEATGNQVKIKLLLNDFNVHLTKKNKQVLRISFSNNAGVIHAVLWDNQGEVKKYRSEERRVGKECRYRWTRDEERKKREVKKR